MAIGKLPAWHKDTQMAGNDYVDDPRGHRPGSFLEVATGVLDALGCW